MSTHLKELEFNSNSHRIKRDFRWDPPFTENRINHLTFHSRRELKGEFFDKTGIAENFNLKLYRHAMGSSVRTPIDYRPILHEQSLTMEMEAFPNPTIVAFNKINVMAKQDYDENDPHFEGPTMINAMKTATRAQIPIVNTKIINELEFNTIPDINRKYAEGHTLSKSNELRAEAMIKVEVSNVETSASTSLLTSTSKINITIKENTSIDSDGGLGENVETLDMTIEVYRFAEQTIKLPSKRYLEGLIPNNNVRLLDDGQTLLIYTTEIGTSTVYTDKGSIKIITLPGLKTRAKGITHI